MSLLNIIQKHLSANKPPLCTAVIAAAGISARCEGEDKLFYDLCGKPVLAHSLIAFNKCKLINEIIIVAHEDKLEEIGELCLAHKIKKVTLIIKGGDTRLKSVIGGVYAATKKATHIAIHDGARPCISVDIIEKTINEAVRCSAAAPAIPITSTVKKVDSDGVIESTVDRGGLYEIQTPQIFRAPLIKAGLTKAQKESIDITDDCMAVEKIGFPVRIVEGSRKNIKITQPDDLKLAEAFMKKES